MTPTTPTTSTPPTSPSDVCAGCGKRWDAHWPGGFCNDPKFGGDKFERTPPRPAAPTCGNCGKHVVDHVHAGNAVYCYSPLDPSFVFTPPDAGTVLRVYSRRPHLASPLTEKLVAPAADPIDPKFGLAIPPGACCQVCGLTQSKHIFRGGYSSHHDDRWLCHDGREAWFARWDDGSGNWLVGKQPGGDKCPADPAARRPQVGLYSHWADYARPPKSQELAAAARLAAPPLCLSRKEVEWVMSRWFPMRQDASGPLKNPSGDCRPDRTGFRA